MDYLNMDINILLSIINMKLRNNYSSLSCLCEEENIDCKSLENRLKEIGYDYDPNNNQFVCL